MADLTALPTDGTAPSMVNGQMTSQVAGPAQDDVPMIDIAINNVVCTFSTKCHLNLRKIATEGSNVEYHRQHGMLNMRLRHPAATASIWSSGKITCTGAVSEEYSKIAARKVARKIQKMGYKCRFTNFRIVNVLGTCAVPFSIDLNKFASVRKETSYEPELHPGATYKIKDPKATLKIFSTGSITVTAPRVCNIQLAIEHIYPLLTDFNIGPRRILPSSKSHDNPHRFAHKRKAIEHIQPVVYADNDYDSDDLDTSDEEFDSDESHD